MAVITKMFPCFTIVLLLNCHPVLCYDNALSTLDKINIITNVEKSGSFLDDINSTADFEHTLNSVNISDVSNGSRTNITLKTKHKNFTLVVLFLITALFIVLINVRVFYLVVTRKPKKSRPVNIFLAHLASIAIGFTFVMLFYVLEKSSFFSITAPGLCELFSFLRNGLLCIFPLNAVAIIYVRVLSSKITTGYNVLAFRVISLIWLIALVGNLPSVFMVEYSKDPLTQLECCKQIPLLGRYELTILYEVYRFLIFHFVECFYMAFVLFQIRSKIKYLYILKPIPNSQMKRKMQRVRYLYVHSILFILIWLPTGVAIAIYKVLCRKEVIVSYVKSFLTPLLVLCTSLFILSPLIHLLLHEDMSGKFFCGISLWPKFGSHVENRQQRINAVNRQNEGKRLRKTMKQNKLMENSDMSRISTVGVSISMADQRKDRKKEDILTGQSTSTSATDSVGTAVCANEAEQQKFGKETSV